MIGAVIPVEDWGPLQAALDARKVDRRVRTTGHDYLALGLVFCGACGGKVYRWRRPSSTLYYGRCRNELKRAEARQPCRMAMIPYQVLDSLIVDDILKHDTDRIEVRATTARVKMRVDEIGRDLIRLSEDFAAGTVSRGDFADRQAVLLDAMEATESGAQWLPAGETVGERWRRLSQAERRLWLLRAGICWRLYRDDRDGARRWRVDGEWCPDGPGYRERIVRAN